MRYRQLEAFRAVMRAGSVTQAAEMLNVSQPAVSRLIACLEQDVGFPLFRRRRGRLQPTPEADFLLGEVERAIANLDHVAQIADDIRKRRTGHLPNCLVSMGEGMLHSPSVEIFIFKSLVSITLNPFLSICMLLYPSSLRPLFWSRPF